MARTRNAAAKASASPMTDSNIKRKASDMNEHSDSEDDESSMDTSLYVTSTKKVYKKTPFKAKQGQPAAMASPAYKLVAFVAPTTAVVNRPTAAALSTQPAKKVYKKTPFKAKQAQPFAMDESSDSESDDSSVETRLSNQRTKKVYKKTPFTVKQGQPMAVASPVFKPVAFVAPATKKTAVANRPTAAASPKAVICVPYTAPKLVAYVPPKQAQANPSNKAVPTATGNKTVAYTVAAATGNKTVASSGMKANGKPVMASPAASPARKLVAHVAPPAAVNNQKTVAFKVAAAAPARQNVQAFVPTAFTKKTVAYSASPTTNNKQSMIPSPSRPVAFAGRMTTVAYTRSPQAVHLDPTNTNHRNTQPLSAVVRNMTLNTNNNNATLDGYETGDSDDEVLAERQAAAQAIVYEHKWGVSLRDDLKIVITLALSGYVAVAFAILAAGAAWSYMTTAAAGVELIQD